MSKLIVFVALLLISPAAYGATITVGGSSGWDNSVNFESWASSQTFAVGDTLVFNYDISHAVDEVNAADYGSCNTANAISSSSSSPTTISLTAPGTRYFLCPRSNHCTQGMKVAITVAGTSPPSGGTTPSPPGTSPSPPSETPNSGSPPPPPAGGDASTLGGRNSFVVGVLLGLVGMVMG